jgi:4-diphosphocytidyl-2-C-methyl-D-erythritol kinase
MTALALDAPAKINLYLAVLDRREDGYHEVETILQSLTLCDTLIAETAGEGIELVVDASEIATGLPVAVGEDNLVCRAARGFFAAAHEVAEGAAGVRFHLTKRIPAGGGLGGGSSDAAAALRLLNALHGGPLDDRTLHAVACELGSDVPFFLQGGTQLGWGTGTDLLPLAGGPHLHFVLILPRTGTSTGAIYKNHGAQLTPRRRRHSIRGGKVPDIKEIAVATGFPNDLEASALQLHPELAELRDRVAADGYPEVRMSGSGSTFFVALGGEAECAAAIERLAPLRDQAVTLLHTETNHAPPGDPRVAPIPPSDSPGAN